MKHYTRVELRPVQMVRTPTRILFLVPTLRGGGAERVMVALLKHLPRADFSLALAVVDMSDAVFKAEIPADVEIIDLKCLRVRQAAPAIFRLIWRRKPDVVFSTLGYLNLAIAVMKTFLPRRIRYVARETAMVSHGVNELSYPGVGTALYRAFYKRLDLVICQSNAMLTDVSATFRVPRSKMVVINNPVDIEHVRRQAANKIDWPHVGDAGIRLVAAGRLGREKGFDLLIEALALLDDVPLQLVILGKGALEAELKDLAARCGVAQRIAFVGYQDNPYAWIAQADAFVLASRHEGFPNVVIESLACGRPVIATPAPGGTLEILASVPDAVVASDISATALAAAIRKWVNSRTEKRCPPDLSRYELDFIISRYAAVLRDSGAR